MDSLVPASGYGLGSSTIFESLKQAILNILGISTNRLFIHLISKDPPDQLCQFIKNKDPGFGKDNIGLAGCCCWTSRLDVD